MSVNSDEDKQLLELDHRSWEGEGKRGNNGVEDEERRLVEEDESKSNGRAGESKSNGRAGDVKGRQGGAVQAQTVTQQPQGSTVCWERFLPLRSLKVLLVEYDDCTRHVVTALLRNCSYEVIPVANGVQAWKILEDLTNHVDLVLTEVVMPCVSGVGLLSKIMNHKTRKNVPVIMMSSHDSMGLVFKCLSKGAVDFLVKPIRKNELKNLWQHIWRRCHSSSGSGTGSESGTQTQRSIRSKSVEKSGNNSGSNDEEDNVSTDLNIGDGSDNGSGTQSSWTKKAVEVDSPRHAYSWPHPDSTCAQVVHSNAESLGNKLLPAAATRECQQQKEQNDNFAMGKDLEICLTGTKDLQHGQRNDFSTKLAGTRQNNLLETGSCKRDEKIDKGKLNLNHESPSSMLKYDGATATGVVTNPTDSQMDNTQFEASNRHYNALDVNNKANSDTHELPSVELSLKRLRGVEGTETTVQDDRNVLRRSDYSAFSRYNAASNANKGPSGNVGSNSPHDNSGEVTKKEFSCDIRSHSRDNPPNQYSIGGRNINDMGSTTNNDVPKSQVANKSAAAAASTVQLLHPSSAFHPVKDLKSATEHVIVDNANDVETETRIQSRDTQKQLQIQNLHHDYDQHRVHHHVVYNKQEQHLRDNNDLSLNKLAAAAPHCGSSNGTGPVEGNPGNYSINGSGSGSNHGSNGQNGGSGGHNVGGTNLESDYGVAGKSGSGDGSGNQSGNRVDENKKQREAALTKFRQKRTERCFRKKVRYQNRKKLADQRPRIRGQFVRHTVSENTSRTTDI